MTLEDGFYEPDLTLDDATTETEPTGTEEVVEEVVEAEEAVVETPIIEEDAPDEDADPWAWAKEHDPEKVRKTFEKFTPEWKAVQDEKARLATEADELAPVRGLATAMKEDAGLVKAIEAYYAEGDGKDVAEAARISNVEERLTAIQVRAAIDAELAELRNVVQKDGNPEFDNDELVRFAGEKHLPTLAIAYDVKFGVEIREAAVERALADVKANAKAKVTTVTKVATPVAAITLQDLENESDEAFLARMKAK